MVKAPLEILQTYWGYDSFRDIQQEIVDAVLGVNDTLALLPTGGGKSICFQVPGLILEGTCIVVSPLIALMRDQVNQLKKRGIAANAIFSGMKKREIDIVLDNCIYGKTKFLYVSPERLKTELFLSRAKKMNISLLAVDEAHCISQWGYDFRPSYLEIATFRELIPSVPTIALTASATKEVKKDIIDKLKFNRVVTFQKSFARKNLSYSVFHIGSKEEKMLEILRNVAGSAIVYVSSRRKTIDIAILLQKQGFRATYYHGGLDGSERMTRQQNWVDNKVRVMVSTNAFGMGIDKPDVRTVIHLDIPDSIEGYYQEAGRAGRDDKSAYAVLLYNENDLESLRARVLKSAVSVDLLKRVYQSLANHLKIAVGSHSMESFEIDIKELIKLFKLPATETYYALKKLEEEGLVQLNEGIFYRSRVNFLLSKTELYKFQVANELLDPVIKTLLRLYGGELFNSYLQIKEDDIGRLIGLPVQEVVKKLKYLNQLEVLNYAPKSDQSRLTFLTARQDANRIEIDQEKINYRNAVIVKKMEDMIAFLQNTDRCRTQQIQEYFDEISYINCNVCDYCINVKRSKDKERNISDIRSEMMSFKDKGKINVFQFRKQLSPDEQYFFSEALRELMEEGIIKLELDMVVFNP